MPIPIATLQKGNFSGIREPLQAVVRSQEQWTALWEKHASNQSPPVPPPINFSAEMIAGLFAGEKRSGGYEIEITGAEQKDAHLFIYYVEKTSPPVGIVIQALTQPFHFVKLPRLDLPIVFEKASR